MYFSIGTLPSDSQHLRGETVDQTVIGRLLKGVDSNGDRFNGGTSMSGC